MGWTKARMLAWMLSQTAPASTADTVSGFARLFAGLTAAPKRQSPESDPVTGREESWLEDALGEDFKTISYEQALRTHARSRPPARLPDFDAAPDRARPQPAEELRVSAPKIDDRAPTLARNQKSSSITLRLTGPECAQVRARAADADMTMSAYLRSCIFEVESLRSQVKDALAQLHTASVREPRPELRAGEEHKIAPAKHWRSRLFAPWVRPRIAGGA